MKYIKNLLATVALAAVAACSTGEVTVTQTHSPNTYAGAPVDQMNTLRRQNGQAPLKYNAKLSKIARAHGEDMARNNYFAHESPNGGTLSSRAKSANYSYCYISENIGFGEVYSTPQSMLNGWMNSPGHKKNMLNPKAKEVGYAKVTDPDGSHDLFWVMVYGKSGC